MATFKVGQRVKIIAPDALAEVRGREATIVAIPSRARSKRLAGLVDCDILIDQRPSYYKDGSWSAPFSALAPLTPPAEDKFIALVKSWGPLPEEMYESIVVTENATYSIKGTEVKRISK